MPKLYFAHLEDELCCTLNTIKEQMKEAGIYVCTVYEAKRMTGTGYFFCTEYLEVREVGTCGTSCEKYVPNNGKNGRCKNYGYVYEETDKSKVIQINDAL